MVGAITIKRNISLKNLTTFKIGGRAKYFTEIVSKKQLIQVLRWVNKKKLPFFVLGNGSNVLFKDDNYSGLVIKLNNSTINCHQNKTLTLGAGVYLPELLQKCVKNEWGGLEWAAGIPGTIGGAVYGNAGAFGHEIKDRVIRVTTIDPINFIEKSYYSRQCQFGYRTSVFKQLSEIIWKVELAITPEPQSNIQQQMIANLASKQVLLKYASAGSVFKNVLIQETPYRNSYNPKTQEVKILNQRIKVKGGKVSAGWFIEACGLKGKKRGKAMIAPFHANVIINLGGAKADEVIYLIELCQRMVWKKFKIKLEVEIIII
jgi:UDP-N-acetylmuramate dehydrogenase